MWQLPCQEQAKTQCLLLTEGGDREDLDLTEDSGERSTGQPVASAFNIFVIPRASVSLAVKGLFSRYLTLKLTTKPQ